MATTFEVDYTQVDAIAEAVAGFAGDAERALTDALHGSGPTIYGRINPLISPSGRTFKGHAASARKSDWPRYDTGANLAVTVSTKAKWRYLYFPDDGSSTVRHAGNQQFFRRGGELAAPEVVERCVAALMDETEEWA